MCYPRNVDAFVRGALAREKLPQQRFQEIKEDVYAMDSKSHHRISIIPVSWVMLLKSLKRNATKDQGAVIPMLMVARVHEITRR